MKETRYFYVPEASARQELPEEEAQHAVRVLRLQTGDSIMLMDGNGTFYQAEVTVATPHHCGYKILKTLPQQASWRGHLHLAIAPTKLMDRMEWLTEKATEIGFNELSLLDCQFSERRVVKKQRLEKIIVSAVKQSRKAWIPSVNEIQSFDNFIKHHQSGRRYIAHCYDEINRVNLFDELRKQTDDEDIIVMIGPEGDFSIPEVRKAIEAGFISVDLGKSRLRTETAGLAAVMMMQLAQQ